MTFHELNTLPPDMLTETLFNCCGSTTWVKKMRGFFPMDDLVEMLEDAEEQWFLCDEADWREAFEHHPKIGGIKDPEKNFIAATGSASDEQQAIKTAAPETLAMLAEANAGYEKKFGYIFIVSAPGKSVEELLGLLQERISNTPENELKIAIDEQNKITLFRLQKLIT